jgi:hypothetical protein
MSDDGGNLNTAGSSPADHPAGKAWRRFAPDCRLPDRVELLKEDKGNWGVYRLCGIGPAGTSIIAKRCELEAAEVECLVYAEILPQLDIRSLRCYGSTSDDDPNLTWMFLEDAGNGKYTPDSEEDRVLAGLWLGAMHRSAVRLRNVKRLPDRGPDSYLEILQLARRMTWEKLGHTAFDAESQELIRRIANHCTLLETRWQHVEGNCAKMPRTLVHGDLSVWNVRVQNDGPHKQFLVMDWESAGWGVPAADLAQFASNSLTPDLDAYWSAAQVCWPQLAIDDFYRLVNVGSVFRWINAVAWVNWGFDDSASRRAKAGDSAESPGCAEDEYPASTVEWYAEEMKWYDPLNSEWAQATRCALDLD